MDMTNQGNRHSRRSGAIALCAVVLAAGGAGWMASPRTRTADAAADRRAEPVVVPEHVAEATPMPASPIQAMPILEEAPSVLHALHRSVMTDPAGRNVGAEARISSAFIANTTLAASSLTVTCGAERCEVLGATVRDETAARLAIRSPDFLDAVEQLGYTVGTDMTSGRGQGSELIVYLDRVR